ncbi:MAG: transcription termination/antitermination factor NusG [Clostridia bacterium]|nr:transcription termination/antitermination factor NusG [Clostridia bacterium]MBQ3496224.1 transcription termination/antitermination factor NusG [Clostridia bacterium]MBQ4586598.1 transcription termination/antitermination factor NusG [Clostridia bacterium]MBQ6884094.1 transcription termination/antitermination factor NusG [Clostridia bacterium]MBR6687435.1 transcription termination/antitermination factor NusG [Clostridia bacterium]
MSVENAKWYVIHTYSGYEALVEEGLKKLIENNNLGDTIFEIRIPEEETIEEKNGKKKVVKRKKFPCYVFMKMVYNNDLWFLITNTRGVTGFVGPQGRPMPLTQEEVRRMGLDEWVEHVDISIGDNVSIVSGPLIGMIGVVEDLQLQTQKATVKVEVFGRETNVELSFVELQRINN